MSKNICCNCSKEGVLFVQPEYDENEDLMFDYDLIIHRQCGWHIDKEYCPPFYLCSMDCNYDDPEFWCLSENGNILVDWNMEDQCNVCGDNFWWTLQAKVKRVVDMKEGEQMFPGLKEYDNVARKRKEEEEKKKSMLQILEEIDIFLNDEGRKELSLPSTLDNSQRREIHQWGDAIKIGHDSVGSGEGRHILLVKINEKYEGVSATKIFRER